MEKQPVDIEAEKAVLGSIFLDNECFKSVSYSLDADDFYSEPHRDIYRVMKSLHIQGKPIDLVTMVGRLKDEGRLEKTGGATYLAALDEYTPTSANVAYHCKRVKEQSTRRKLIALASKVKAEASNGEVLGDIVASIKSQLADTMAGMDEFAGVSVKDLVTFEQRAERYVRHIREVNYKRFITGFTALDGQIRGVAPGEVLTIIAYSGTFKTAFLQNILHGNAARSGYYSLFFSMEMPIEKVFEREAQIQAGVSGWEVEKKYHALEAHKIYEAMECKHSRAVLVCDKPKLSVEKIGRYIELTREKHGDIGAVGIDYMGLMAAPGKSLFERMEYISIEVKNLAKEMRVPIIMLCQINREAAKAGGIESHSAKGGGDIEAGADFMLGFHRDKDDQLLCKILKNRNGAAGLQFEVEIDRSTLQFKGMKLIERRQTKDSKAINF